jgi:hypothetical protein
MTTSPLILLLYLLPSANTVSYPWHLYPTVGKKIDFTGHQASVVLLEPGME